MARRRARAHTFKRTQSKFKKKRPIQKPVIVNNIMAAPPKTMAEKVTEKLMVNMIVQGLLHAGQWIAQHWLHL